MSNAVSSYDLDHRDGAMAIVLHGDWVTSCLGDAPERLLAEARGASGAIVIDAQDLGRLDTSGTFAIFRALGGNRDVTVEPEMRTDIATLAELLGPALEAEPRRVERGGIARWFDDFGRTICSIGHNAYRQQAFTGQLMVALARTVARPRRLRGKALVSTMQQAGLAGLPIVFIMTFFIGAVLALVGSTMLQTLGVTVYSVELVGIGILREFGAVIAAILFAGRSASAFTAQLGSMRMNQEVDAMRVMGVDIFDALVVPRVLAALIMLPLMTVVADVQGDGRRAVTNAADAAAELKATLGEARAVLAGLSAQSKAVGSTTLPQIGETMHSLQETSDNLDVLNRASSIAAAFDDAVRQSALGLVDWVNLMTQTPLARNRNEDAAGRRAAAALCHIADTGSC